MGTKANTFASFCIENDAWFLEGLLETCTAEDPHRTVIAEVTSIQSTPVEAEKEEIYPVKTSQPEKIIEISPIPPEIVAACDEISRIDLVNLSIYHSVRACARFLSFPTPSVPNDNEVFGHIHGWIWLLYKGILNLKSYHTEITIKEHTECLVYLKGFHEEMGELAKTICKVEEEYKLFIVKLEQIYIKFRKGSKSLRKISQSWSKRASYCVKFQRTLKLDQGKLLVDVAETHDFGSNWCFDPNKESAGSKDFFHFQWVKTSDWMVFEFEMRSDYSKHWSAYTKLSPELQLHLIIHTIRHVNAMMNEVLSFSKSHLNLSCEMEDISNLFKLTSEAFKNKESSRRVEDLLQKLYQDFAMLIYISDEFIGRISSVLELLSPLYNTMKLIRPNCRKLTKLNYPGARRRFTLSTPFSCLRSIKYSEPTFLELFGEPNLRAVLLRTPIDKEILQLFFPIENRHFEKFVPIPDSHSINNNSGDSTGYQPSIFDNALGRRQESPPPPVKELLVELSTFPKRPRPQKLPFSFERLLNYAYDCISDESENEVDLEIYICLWDQLSKFLELLGTVFSFVSWEVQSSSGIIEKWLYGPTGENFKTFEKMVKFEIANGSFKQNINTSGTRAFITLHRALLFVSLFMEKLAKLNANEEVAPSCRAIYLETLGKLNPQLVQKAVQIAINLALPKSKLEFRNKVSPSLTMEELNVIFSKIASFNKKIYDQCDKILVDNKLQNI